MVNYLDLLNLVDDESSKFKQQKNSDFVQIEDLAKIINKYFLIIILHYISKINNKMDKNY